MSLMEDIIPYTDSYGMVAPSKVSKGAAFVSGNGVMYTSELYIIANKLHEIDYNDVRHFEEIIDKCIDSEGVLNRFPLPHMGGQEGPDDYYGLLNACVQLNLTKIPKNFLKAVVRHRGALNNENPGKWTFQSFLIRQPQLLACMITAAFPNIYNLLHIVIHLAFLPLYVISAIYIATNSMLSPTNEVDTRRLCWHVIQVLSKTSILCKIASLIWYNRLHMDYGPEGMKAVAASYYSSGHPFSKYWVD